MQGPNAAGQVMAAVTDLDRQRTVDVIVIARGGGSFEDLLPFSDEGLIRTVAACRTPVVSAIGHESDTPILDLVADRRASTPTDAAKQVVPDVAVELQGVRQSLSRLRQAITATLSAEERWLTDLRTRPVLRDPLGGHQVHVDQVAALRERSTRAVTSVVRDESTAVAHALERVRAMSPKATLDRGYTILVHGDGVTTVTSVADVDDGDDLSAHLADGTLVVEVRTVIPRKEPT
jgi:exodeoxyribonuclease VII large subunit